MRATALNATLQLLVIYRFPPLVFLPLYIYLIIALHVISRQIHIDQKQCHLPSIFQRHLPSSNIVVSSNPNLYENEKDTYLTAITILILRFAVVNLWVL